MIAMPHLYNQNYLQTSIKFSKIYFNLKKCFHLKNSKATFTVKSMTFMKRTFKQFHIDNRGWQKAILVVKSMAIGQFF
jgi:hypothetical protein